MRSRSVAASMFTLGMVLAGSTQGRTTSQVAPGEQPQDVTCVIELAPMRDGVKLATEVYLPAAAGGRFPVIL